MTITQRVTNILKYSHKARNYPKELELIYMQKSGMNLTPEQQQAFRDMDDLWSVRRQCQTIQAKGIYPPDPAVKKIRSQKAMVIQQNAPTASPERLEQLIRQPLRWGE